MIVSCCINKPSGQLPYSMQWIVALLLPLAFATGKGVLDQLKQSTAFGFHAKATQRHGTGLVWKQIHSQSHPSEREGQSIVYDDTQAILFGGCLFDLSCYNDVWVYSFNTKSWNLQNVGGDVFPGPRGGHSAVLSNEKMYIFGGYTQQHYLRDVYVLDTVDWQWDKLETRGIVPGARQGHTAVVYDSQMFVFGGYGEKGYLGDMLVLDLDLANWIKSSSPDAPTARAGHSATGSGHHMYVFGGMTDGHTYNDVHVFDFRLQSWGILTDVDDSPPPMQEHAAVAYGGDIYVVGGCNYHIQECYNELYRLDPQANRWNRYDGINMSRMEPREGHSVFMHGDGLYLFGGCYLSQECHSDTHTLVKPRTRLSQGKSNRKQQSTDLGEDIHFQQRSSVTATLLSSLHLDTLTLSIGVFALVAIPLCILSGVLLRKQGVDNTSHLDGFYSSTR